MKQVSLKPLPSETFRIVAQLILLAWSIPVLVELESKVVLTMVVIGIVLVVFGRILKHLNAPLLSVVCGLYVLITWLTMVIDLFIHGHIILSLLWIAASATYKEKTT